LNDLTSCVDGIFKTVKTYDKTLLDACLSLFPSQGPALLNLVRDRTSGNSEWRSLPLGIWAVARLLESVAEIEPAIGAWDEIIDRGVGPVREALYSRARLKEQLGRRDEALVDLARAIEDSREFPFLSKAASLLARMANSQAPQAVRRIRLALLSSTTPDLLAPLLRLICFRERIDAEMYVGAYDGYRREILDPDSKLYEFFPDIVIIATHWRDAHLPAFSADPDSEIERVLGEFRELWQTLLSRHPSQVILHNFDIPGNNSYGYLGARMRGGQTQMLREINRRLLEEVPPSVAVLDLEGLSANYGKRCWQDPRYWYAVKQYPSSEALPDLVDQQVALIKASLGLAKKVLVLDLDNTLWGGIIGEDGPSGIVLGPPSGRGEAYQAFQRYVLELKDRGILLAVCSKNNPDDAQLPFLRHDATILHLEDFAIFKANWLDKPTNLREIAKTLKLGLDSFVFVDDSPIERALVKRELPEIAVPDMGEDPATFVDILDRGLFFESFTLSQEDRERSESYRSNVQREELCTSSRSYEDFLRSLNMEASIGAFNEEVLSRVVQLIGKTNQFNLTSRRHSEESVRRMMASKDYWTQYFKLKDKFGDNGLIGVMISRELPEKEKTWEIDTWLMSCRVIGRGMEQFMLWVLGEAARARKVRHIQGIYVPTQRNAMVSGLYGQLGFSRLERSGNDEVFVLDLAERMNEPDRFIKMSSDPIRTGSK
jgi:FkbH-like protein